MARTSRQFALPLPPPRAGEALADWLHRELRAAILDGRMRPGTHLPPTRTLATACGIARGTVVRAFEQLHSEGYLEGRMGSGTRVHSQLPDHYLKTASPQKASPMATRHGKISKRGRLLSESPFLADVGLNNTRAFCANCPSVSHFPVELWSRLAARRMRLASRGMLSGGDVLGYRPLREAIAAHLGSTRGVVGNADQILIVSGTQQSLDLVARLTLDPGDKVWMEDPGYPGAVSILRAAGANLVPIPVDVNGLRVAEGIKRAPHARMAYVTPANQFPLCVALPIERRLKLLEWSMVSGAWIFEDDYDSEFRFEGRPLAAMQGLAPAGNVIFSGSFSKMLFPALRLGYVVLPPHLVEPMTAARSIMDRYASILAQAALCDFIIEGHFERHLRRMRQIYAEHLGKMSEAAREEWGDRLVIQPTHTGLQTVCWLAPGSLDDQAFAQAARACGVEMGPISSWTLKARIKNGLQIGFAAAGPTELLRGVRAVGSLL